MSGKLNIFTAGVSMRLVKKLAEEWNSENYGIQASVKAGGSVEGVRELIDGNDFDLLFLADDTIIESMLMPDHVSGYYVFAANKMVIGAKEGKSISNEDWKEKLLDPSATFKHMSPYGDPGGYRAVMAMMLADKYEEGLSAKLFGHPGLVVMDPDMTPENMPRTDYMFLYYSGAKSRGLSFAELPAVMDLSDESLAELYATAKFQIDENTTVAGAPIRHAMTIPKAAANSAEARRFAEKFLAIDLAKHNFMPLNINKGF